MSASAITAQVKVNLQGYYRGQRLIGDTVVTMDRTPQRVLTSFAPPDNAGFAVRADPSFQGAIAIVLDYSGSMGARPDGSLDATKPDSKFQQMLQVLPKVLADIPPGTHLSIRLYGHLDLPVNPPGAPPNSAPEEQRLRFWTPLTQDERIIQEVIQSGPKKKDQLDNVMKKLTALLPRYYTPLVHSMKEAKANDFPKGFTGPRTLLVLTDGADTWYGLNDPQRRSKREFEEAFQDSDITVQMVVFKANASEVKIANEQFGEVVRFSTPGSIEMAENAQALSDQLDAALRPKLRLVDANGQRVRGVPRYGLPANAADASLNSLHYVSGPIEPGLYNGYVFRNVQPIGFDKGDRLLVRLFKADNGIGFERDLLAKDKLWQDRTKAEGGWVLGVPQVRDELTMQGRKLRLMTTVESTVGLAPKDGVLKQTWPRSVWWEVAPAVEGGPRPGTLHVSPLYGYPAPAWELLVDQWADPADPQQRRARVNVWCQADVPPVVTRVKVEPGGPPQDVDLDDGQKVSVAAAVEKHALFTGVGSRDGQLPAIDCLAVRVRHALKDRPVQVQLVAVPGVAKPAEEHRYYGSVNYTALFGPVTADQIRGKTVELEFVSVAKLKSGATPISFDPPPPRRGEERPRSFDLKTGER
jgi:hypothetical protein